MSQVVCFQPHTSLFNTYISEIYSHLGRRKRSTSKDETGLLSLVKNAAENEIKRQKRDTAESSHRQKRAFFPRRHYFLMVEDYEWDYGPSGTDLYFTGESLTKPGS